MADEPKQWPERGPLYFRLDNDIPAMVWPAPNGEEAIIQIGRQRPWIASRYTEKDHQSMNVIVIDLLAKTKALVSASDWHTAMGTSVWPDDEVVIWSKADV
jgi:hypothetical protein